MDDERGGVQRDKAGNALLIPAGGGTLRATYTSASSLYDQIPDNLTGLRKWEMRYLARGMARRPDLQALALTETYSTGFEMENPTANKASGRRLDQVIERALDEVKVHEKADYGTAIHALTEPGGRDNLPAQILEQYRMKPDLDSWDRMLAATGMQIVATEQFTANDGLMAAGTVDHVARWPGLDELVVVDKKVGKVKRAATQCQTYVYASGELYDPETDQRASFESVYGAPVSQRYSLLVNIVARGGKTDVYLLDLQEGRADAQLAARLRDRRAVEDTMPQLLGSY